jgi:hypothetical protein
MIETNDPTPVKTRPEPQDHKPKKKKGKSAQRAEVDNDPITFEWDGETWEFDPANGTGLEFMAALEDADNGGDPGGLIRAMRILLGRDQASRLFKGRDASDIFGFFGAAEEAAGLGNR